MKTKIVYISGAEVFDMKDVRDALDTVRAALNLGNDTIVFGVPVDSDTAFADAPSDTPTDVVAAACEQIDEIVTEEAVADAVAEPEPESVPEPVAPRRRGRPKKVVAEEAAAPAPDASDKVVPILSVLAAKAEAPVAEVAVEIDDDVVVVDDADDADDTVADVEPDTESVVLDADDVDTVRVTVSEMIADDAPVAPAEKTLEELLESMTPLCDDHAGDDVSENTDDVADVDFDAEPDETDATLEKLATEFAESEPDITPDLPKSTEGRSKIGKLKNILPFKKARRDAGSSLRDDLFNWAGIAANDEEFAIPGFFANASGNK